MISSIDMYNLLREKIGDQQAKMLTDYVEQRVFESFEKEKEWLATKKDIADVKTEIALAKAEQLRWMVVLFMPFYVGMIVFLIKWVWQ